ncbi:MAG TPA: FHA domain-containing protein [Thermoanaerobaculia bacterium]|nr:FHA domain-containing protein [Thermoanaerobaculia bacterium]
MADKRCENGHFIDESWDICPYCPHDQSEPEIPIVRPTRNLDAPRPTAAPGPRAIPNVSSAPLPPPPSAISAVPDGPRLATFDGDGGRAAHRSNGGGSVAVPPMERTVAASKLDGVAQPKRYVVGWLVGLSGAVRGESYPVRIGRNVIGRDRRSDIVINDDQASSHHADLVFRPEERRFILMDHNSTNGTYVNENEIEPRRDLSGKDVIRIGSHKYLFMPLCDDLFFWDDEGLLK